MLEAGKRPDQSRRGADCKSLWIEAKGLSTVLVTSCFIGNTLVMCFIECGQSTSVFYKDIFPVGRFHRRVKESSPGTPVITSDTHNWKLRTQKKFDFFWVLVSQAARTRVDHRLRRWNHNCHGSDWQALKTKSDTQNKQHLISLLVTAQGSPFKLVTNYYICNIYLSVKTKTRLLFWKISTHALYNSITNSKFSWMSIFTPSVTDLLSFIVYFRPVLILPADLHHLQRHINHIIFTHCNLFFFCIIYSKNRDWNVEKSIQVCDPICSE